MPQCNHNAKNVGEKHKEENAYEEAKDKQMFILFTDGMRCERAWKDAAKKRGRKNNKKTSHGSYHHRQRVKTVQISVGLLVEVVTETAMESIKIKS